MFALNIKYAEIELCTIVLNAVNLTVSTAYYAAVQNEFPTDITRLTSKLTRVCDQNKEHKRLLNDMVARLGLKPKDRKRGGGTPAAASGANGGDANKGARCGGCA